MANVLFKSGLAADFMAMENKVDTTFYFLTDTKELYIGGKKLTNGADIDASINELSTRITDNDNDIKDLQDTLAALTGGEGSAGGTIGQQIEALKTELTALINTNTTNITANTNAIAALQAVDSTLEQEINGATALGNEALEKIEALDERVTTLDKEGGEVDLLKGRVTALEAADGDFTTEIESLKAKDTTLESSITSHDNKLTELEGEIDANTSGLAEVKKTVDAFFAEDAAVDATLDTLKEIQEWVNTHEGEAGELVTNVQNLDTRLKAAEGTITTHNTDIATNKDNIATLTSRMEAVEGDIIDLGGSISEVNTSLTDYKAEITEDLGEINTALTGKASQADLDKVSERVTTNTDNVSSLTTDLAALTEKVNGFGDIVDSDKSEFITPTQLEANTTTTLATAGEDASTKATAAQNAAIEAAATDATTKANAAQAAAIAHADNLLTWQTSLA